MLRGKRILIAEDEAINRLYVVSILKSMGCEVDQASNGLQTYNKCLNTAYDAIIMDISMPRMSGCDVVRKLRDEDGPCRKTPILGLTAHSMPRDIERYKSYGMNDVVGKPFDSRNLMRVLESVM